MRWLLRVLSAFFLSLSLISPALAAEPDGMSPANAVPLVGTVSGSLIGSQAGAFAYYTFAYPGDGSQGTLTLTFAPTDPTTAGDFGLNLYQNGTLLGTASGVGSTPGSSGLTFASTVNAPVLAQVFDYGQDVPVSFQLSLSGVTAASVAGASVSAPTTPVNGSADNPIPLASPQSSTLGGSSAGSFTYYTFDYPGDSSTQSVTLSFAPSEPDVANAVIVTLFQNGTQLATDNGSDSSTPGQFTVSFSSAVAGPVLVQVANYSPSIGISYTISH